MLNFLDFRINFWRFFQTFIMTEIQYRHDVKLNSDPKMIATDFQAKWLKTNWFNGTFLNFRKNLHFSLCLFFNWNPGFNDKIWVVKRPRNSILSIHTQIIPNQANLHLMNHDLFWSQKVPWIMFIANTNIAFETNCIDIYFWAKMSFP